MTSLSQGLLSANWSESVLVVVMIAGLVKLLAVTASKKNTSLVGGRRRERFGAAVLLVVASLTLRSASFFVPATVDWDENTFLTVARRGLEGELPFTTTFDNKGPISVLVNAMALSLAFDSLIVVRVLLAVLIGLSAYAIFRSVVAIGGRSWHAGLAGLSFIALSGSVPTAGAWHTAHTGNLLLASLFLLLARPQDSRPAMVGALLAALALTRANYALTAGAVWVVWLALTPHMMRWRAGLRSAATASGVLFAVVVIYATQGALDRLLAGLVTVNFAQGHGVSGLNGVGGLATVLVLGQVAGAVLSIAGSSAVSEATRRQVRRISIFATVGNSATAVSISLSNVVHDHHALLLVVFPAIQLGVLATATGSNWAELRAGRPGQRALRGAPIAAGLMILLGFLRSDSFTIDRAEAEREAAVVAAVQNARVHSSGTLWALTDHYVYWRLRERPVHPLVTHPSSISKHGFRQTVPLPDGVGADTAAAVRGVLALSPGIVITSDGLRHWYLDEGAVSVLETALRRNYRPHSQVGGVTIWILNEDE